MRNISPPARVALRVVSPVLLAPVLLAGCGSAADVARLIPAPPPATSAPSDAEIPVLTSTPAGPPERTTPAGTDCDVSVAGNGSFQTSGPGLSEVRTSDAGLFFGCNRRPLVRAQIDPGHALLITYRGAESRIPRGSTRQAGPYRVQVLMLRGAAVRFRLRTA